MSSSDGIALVVAGAVYPYWTGYQLESDFLTPTDGFTFTVADPTEDQVAAVSEGASVQLVFGRTTVLSGWIDEKRLTCSRQGSQLTLTGRDFAAPLVDCSVPLRWTWRDVTLLHLAELALDELGVTADIIADADASQKVKYVRPSPGETFWQVLARETERLRLMLWTEADGLHIGRPDYTSAAVGTLRLCRTPSLAKDNNVKSAEHAWRTSGRRSRVTVVGQSGGDDALFGGSASQVSASATDDALVALGLNRPHVLEDAGCRTRAACTDRAKWEVSSRLGEGWVGTYTVPGHGPSDGVVWDVDSIVNVLDERAGVRGPKWIAARRFARSREGTTTVLTLRDLNAILPAT